MRFGYCLTLLLGALLSGCSDDSPGSSQGDRPGGDTAPQPPPDPLDEFRRELLARIKDRPTRLDLAIVQRCLDFWLYWDRPEMEDDFTRALADLHKSSPLLVHEKDEMTDPARHFLHRHGYIGTRHPAHRALEIRKDVSPEDQRAYYVGTRLQGHVTREKRTYTFIILEGKQILGSGSCTALDPPLPEIAKFRNGKVVDYHTAETQILRKVNIPELKTTLAPLGELSEGDQAYVDVCYRLVTKSYDANYRRSKLEEYLKKYPNHPEAARVRGIAESVPFSRLERDMGHGQGK